MLAPRPVMQKAGEACERGGGGGEGGRIIQAGGACERGGGGEGGRIIQAGGACERRGGGGKEGG